MLPRRRGAVVPGIVRDRDEDRRAVYDLRARNLREHHLVADRRTVTEAAVERRVLRTELELPDGVYERVREEEHLPQRHVLAERHEPDFVVVADRLSAADEKRRIPHFVRLLRILGDRSEDDVDVARGRDRLDSLLI